MVGSRICDRSKTPRVRSRLGDRRPTVMKRLKHKRRGADMSANNIDRRAEKFVESEGKDYVAVTDLQPGAVGIVGAIMQNVTHIAPAIAAFFFTQTLVTNAGGQAPLAYLIGLIIVIPLGVCLME